MGSFWFDDSKTPRARASATAKLLMKNLSPYFGVFGIFERGPLQRLNDPPACPAWGWGRIGPVLESTRTAVSASR